VIGSTEAGKLDCKPSPLNIVGFCGDLVKQMKVTVESKYKLTCVSQTQQIAPCLDEKLLQHALANLLFNVIKYSPQSGNVQLRLLCQGEAAIFQLEDEGIGIPKQDQPHLFEFFHRAKNVSTIPGTGLGLAFSQRSVDLQGRQIAIGSVIGVGTTVAVTLSYK
jgi:signal transduction histidine kinase